jgi:hypothetical protein
MMHTDRDNKKKYFFGAACNLSKNNLTLESSSGIEVSRKSVHKALRWEVSSPYHLSRQFKAVTRGGVERKPERVRTADAKLPSPKLLSLSPRIPLTPL